MKQREFWISTNTMVADVDKPNYTDDYYAMYKVIHVREVDPSEPDYRALCLELVEALEFYSNPKNYNEEAAPGQAVRTSIPGEPDEWDFDADCGYLAGKALARARKVMGEEK